MLRIYAVVLLMVAEVAPIVKQIARHDRDLAQQGGRALSSVALNTAEGMRNTGGHKRERYQTALGSAQEMLCCLEVAQASRYIGKVDEAILDRIDHVIATLVRLVYPRV